MKKQQLVVIMAIFIGGALGTLFRYAINLQTTTLLFPLGTIIENISGSLLLGLLTGFILIKQMNVILKEAIGVGFCGGFTTMSTLAADAVFLFDEGTLTTVTFYMIASVIGGIIAAFIGLMLGQKLGEGHMKRGESG
ncbi:CrcB family protein [Bacillus shivajii]|uniref:fluoride efflux transporter FluC n=1 Tax=Bacillus shivajii TaxID=1983719 RepID=UPI001CFBA129|nr:CrcB family protein [Bacillus shivajii]UCZ53646.1 CrcB family protein [Bacillus shivajii]